MNALRQRGVTGDRSNAGTHGQTSHRGHRLEDRQYLIRRRHCLLHLPRQGREEGTKRTTVASARSNQADAIRHRKGPVHDGTRRVTVAGGGQRPRGDGCDLLQQVQAVPGKGWTPAVGCPHSATHGSEAETRRWGNSGVGQPVPRPQLAGCMCLGRMQDQAAGSGVALIWRAAFETPSSRAGSPARPRRRRQGSRRAHLVAEHASVRAPERRARRYRCAP